jgi:excisionase family DNA binding protein
MSKQTQDSVEEREYLRVAEVAKAFHVSPKTVARWADEGRIPFVLTLGGHRRFPRKDIERLLPSHAQNGESAHQ